MNDHDDLDRRIRALFGRAGNDSPEPLELRPSHEPAPSRRWLAVAAAALVLVAGIAVIAQHGGHRTSSSADTDRVSSVVPSSTLNDGEFTTVVTPTGAIGGPSTAPPPDDCAAVAPLNYDPFGTIHTIVPNEQPVDVTITTNTGSWCAGGKGSVLATFHNRGTVTVTVDRPTLILSNGPAKWTIGELRASVTLTPDERVSIPADVVAPPAPPGEYSLSVYGFLGSNVPITIDGATECTGSTLQVATSSVGSISSNLKTTVTVTNITAHACLLSEPVAITALEGDRQPEVRFTKSTYFGDPPPLSSHVLEPGASASLWLDTAVPAVCGTPSPKWTSLFFTLSFPYGQDAPNAPVEVKASGAPFDTGCGLGVSAWGQLG